jgi:hypothetical protein
MKNISDEEFENITGVNAAEFELDMLTFLHMDANTSYDEAAKIALKEFKELHPRKQLQI